MDTRESEIAIIVVYVCIKKNYIDYNVGRRVGTILLSHKGIYQHKQKYYI